MLPQIIMMMMMLLVGDETRHANSSVAVRRVMYERGAIIRTCSR